MPSLPFGASGVYLSGFLLLLLLLHEIMGFEIGTGVGSGVDCGQRIILSRSTKRDLSKPSATAIGSLLFRTRKTEERGIRFKLKCCNPIPPPSPTSAASPFQLSASAAAAAAAAANELSERTSPDEVRKEIKRCYELINNLGRGVVYLGSSRVKADHPHYLQAVELAREIAKLLDCTTWTGAGPGLMDAAFKGASEANKPVGGFKISKEAGEWTTSNFHPYLSPETYLTCRFFSARKHALVDAVVRNDPADMTAVVAFPGGIGTLDEMFEILALIQLERIGSNFPVPFLLLNYDSYYSKLLDFMQECEMWGTVAKGEVESLWKVCDGNFEALEYLSEFYNLPQNKRDYDSGFNKGKEIVS